MPLDKSRPTRYNNTSLYITQCYYTRMVLMPAVRKVSKEQIIDAAVEVLRDDGFSAINARSVAKKLGCSTQPIYFSFKNMDELKAALTQRAIELHTQRVRDSLRAHEGSDSRYSSYGMGFVKFAAEEKQLFRWLYLEGEQPGAYQSDVLMQEVIGVIVDEFGYAEDVARRFHQDMIYFTPIIGYQGCRRWRRNMVSRSRPSISLTKNLHRMYPHRSRPMPCSGTVSF